MLTELKRPLTRRVGRLVVTIDPEGITLRGYGQRKRRWFSWAQVASLGDKTHPAIRMAENVDGKRQLEAMGADS